MTQRHHKHRQSHKHPGEGADESSERKFHKDWRVWLVVGLMLLAMTMYVLTLDDSIVPSIMRQ
jgi:hypothetical protein